MGTPAYMAPEQARGEAADARADVFALGGILCAILTGQPPFSGKSTLEVIQRAGAADLAEAYARLDGCGADAELVALCRRCLSPSPADRPADGQAVADGLTAYLNGVQERLQAAERERAVAVARAKRGTASAQGSTLAGGVAPGVHDAGRAEHGVLLPAASGAVRRRRRGSWGRRRRSAIRPKPSPKTCRGGRWL